MAGTDMTTRILRMYETLRRGMEIQKLSYCTENKISERTFDRDIEKIRLFLSEEYSGQDVEYCAQRESYLIPGAGGQGELSLLELMIIIKILKGGQILEKYEFAGIMNSLQSVTERGKGEARRKIIQQEFNEYVEKKECKAFLKLFGDLQKCIEGRNVIRIKVRKSKDSLARIKFCPIAVEYWNSEIFLLGYYIEQDKKLAVFELEEIESFNTTSQKYGTDVGKRYSYQDGQRLLQQIRKDKGEQI